MSAEAPAAGPRTVTAALVMLLFMAPLSNTVAQETSLLPGAADLPRYRVELVVFERTQAPLHPEDPGRPPLPPFQETPFTIGGQSDESGPPQAPPGGNGASADMERRQESIFFDPADIQDLSAILARLRQLRGYRVIAQEAWVQPGFPREQARGVDLETLGRLRGMGGDLRQPPRERSSPTPDSGSGLEDPPQITATLWLGRYLHLEIDAELLRSSEVARLREARRMRSGEVHYFDSPRLGAIAIVLPVQDSGSVSDDTAPGGPPAPAGTG